MQSQDQVSSNNFSPLKTQNVVQHLLASHGFLHLHSWVLLICLLIRPISIGFLGTLFLRFHSNINVIYFTRHHYSKIEWNEIFTTQGSLRNFLNYLKIWDMSYHILLPTIPPSLPSGFPSTYPSPTPSEIRSIHPDFPSPLLTPIHYLSNILYTTFLWVAMLNTGKVSSPSRPINILRSLHFFFFFSYCRIS